MISITKPLFIIFTRAPSPKTNQLRICSNWLFVMFISNHSFALFAVPGLAGYMQCSARLLVWECGNENNTGRGRQPKIVNVISFHQHLGIQLLLWLFSDLGFGVRLPGWPAASVCQMEYLARAVKSAARQIQLTPVRLLHQIIYRSFTPHSKYSDQIEI